MNNLKTIKFEGIFMFLMRSDVVLLITASLAFSDILIHLSFLFYYYNLIFVMV